MPCTHTGAKHLPDVLVSLNIYLMELCVTWLARNIVLHLHGHMPWQDRQQQALLQQTVHL